jgi:hypothetical protein
VLLDSQQYLRRLVRLTWRLRIVLVPEVSRFSKELIETVLALFQWVQLVLFALLWLSFEGYTRAWAFIQTRAEPVLRYKLSTGHRALFCLIVSLVVGHGLMLTLSTFPLSFWSFGFWTAHGLFIHLRWHRGVRWCRHVLGIWPTQYDPERPYDALYLDN